MEKNKQPKLINPAELFDPGPYGFSHSIAVESPSTMCFISGQSGGVGDNHVLADDFKTQVQDALKNLQIVLQSHSMTFENIVKITLLIVDHNQEKLEIWAEEARKVWKSSFLPASTLIPVSQLALPGMMFEIDAIAVKQLAN
ncbi:RidA family protein [Chryseobacterium sp. X308]|uniref:RidA family protein n=1 Tax=Chryseobacterium sp. X308 TaxID=2884873 RepID=UPI001D135690|nr:RidA family protein [Chryseobacterium sp. X308]MCC3217831.1 RidA family protein [Chryseobacterium sp. X308]